MSDSDIDVDALLGELDDVIDGKAGKKSSSKPSQLQSTKSSKETATRPKPSKPTTASKAKKTENKSNSGGGDSDSDLDGLINELDGVVTDISKKTDVKIIKISGGSNKCFPIFLVPPSSKKKTCRNLHCQSCDFHVISIKDKKWNNKCDYMHFRNFHPNVEKLSVNLVPARGTNAYCCQCSWRSVSSEESLSSIPDLRWNCAGC